MAIIENIINIQVLLNIYLNNIYLKLCSLNGCGPGKSLGNGGGRGSLVCCGPWGCKELDMT